MRVAVLAAVCAAAAASSLRVEGLKLAYVAQGDDPDGAASNPAGADFTIGFWLRVDTERSSDCLLHKIAYSASDSIKFEIKSRRIYFAVDKGTGAYERRGERLNGGVWHWIAGRRTGREVAVFRDSSKSFGEDPRSTTSVDVPSFMLLGGCYRYDGDFEVQTYNEFLGGYIDGFRWWNRALSDSEISEAKFLSSVYSANVVHQFNFLVPPIPNPYFDSSINNNHLVLNEAPGAPQNRGLQLISWEAFDPNSPNINVNCAVGCGSGNSQGSCNNQNGVCECQDYWEGELCDIPLADPSETVIRGEGATEAVIGEETWFVIDPRDALGGHLPVGTDVSVVVTPIPGIPFEVVESTSDGFLLFEVVYTPDTPGTQQFNVFVNNEVVRALAVPVLAGAIDPSESAVLNAALYSSQGIFAGNSFVVVVEARDEYGTIQPEPVGVDEFVANIEELGVTVPLVHTTDVFLGTRVLQQAGIFEVTVTSDTGEPVSNSPFDVLIRPGDLWLTETLGSGSGLGDFEAGSTVTVEVRAYDRYGNERPEDSDEFQLVLDSGPETEFDGEGDDTIALAHITDNLYRTSYSLTTAGTYTVLVQSEPGENVRNSPANVVVTPTDVDPDSCNIVGLDPSYRAGEDVQFTLVARDEYNNRRIEPDSFTVSLSPTGGATVQVVWDPTAVNHAVTISGLEQARTYTVTVRVDGTEIDGSGVTFDLVAGDFSFEDSTLSGPASSAPGQLVFAIDGYDSFNNRRSFPSGPFVTVQDGDLRDITADVAVSLQPSGDGVGSFEAEVTIETAGVYFVKAKSGATDISGSPVTVTIVPGPLSLANSFGPDTLSGVAIDRPETFDIVPRDEFGNTITAVGSPGDVPVSMAPSAGTTVSVTPSAGLYTVSVEADNPGSFLVTVGSGGDFLPSSPLAFEVVPAPTTSGIQPDTGPDIGGTTLTVSGTSFLDNSDTYCLDDSDEPLPSIFVSSTELVCVTPAAAAGATLSVSVTNNAGATIVPVGDSFTYYEAVTVDTVLPTTAFSWGGEVIEVTGSNFLNVTGLFCFFGNTRVRARYQSPSLVRCTSPRGDAGIVQLGVTNNGQQAFSGQDFRFTESFSNLCRDEIDLAVLAERISTGFDLFPNLAVTNGATVVPSELPLAPGIFPEGIIDADRCCELTDETLGFQCGLLLPQQSSGTVSVEIQLTGVALAFVNAMVISWFDPCRNEPPQFDLEYFDESEGWTKILTRSTTAAGTSQRPCLSIPSDAGKASLCLDFFVVARARRFRVVFDNTPTSMGAAPAFTDGGWLYEVEVHGIMETDPWALEASFDAPLGAVPTEAVLPLPSIDVTTLNYVGESLDGSDPVTHTLSVVLRNGEGADVTAQYLSGLPEAGTYELELGSLSVSGLALLAPPEGEYTLELGSATLGQGTTLPITILVGEPVLWRVDSPLELTVAASFTAALGEIRLVGLDAADEEVGTAAAQERSVTASLGGSVALQGVTTRPMRRGVVVFDDLALATPTAGSYVLELASAGLPTVEIAVTVTLGEAVGLVIVSADSAQLPSDTEVPLPAILVRSVDAGGNFLLQSDNTPRAVVLRVTDPESGASVSGVVRRVMADGEVEFSGVSVVDPPAGVTQVTLTDEAQLLVPDDFSLEVTVGAAQSIAAEFEAGGGSEPVLPSEASTPIPAVSVVALDASGAAAAATEGLRERFVALSLSLVVPGDDGVDQLVPVPGLIEGGTANATLVGGTATIDSVALVGPPTGRYELEMAIEELGTATVRFVVEVGSVAQLSLVGADEGAGMLEVVSLATVSLPLLSLRALDAGGNFVGDGSGTLDLSSSTLTTSDSVPLVDGRAVFSSVVVASPPTGEHVIDIVLRGGPASAVLAVQLVVTVGPAAELRLASPSAPQDLPTRTAAVLFPLEIVAVDAGGTPVGNSDAAVRTVSVVCETAGCTLGGLSAGSMVNGTVTLDAIELDRPAYGSYTVRMSSLGLVSTTYTFDVVAGPPQTLELVGAAAVVEPADQFVQLPSVTFSCLDAVGGAINLATLAEGFVITASIDGIKLADSSQTQVTIADSLVVFDLLILEEPLVGDYVVRFSHPEIVAESLLLEVTVGDPVRVAATNPSGSNFVRASPELVLPRVAIEVQDAGNNAVLNLDTENRTVEAFLLTSPQPFNLTGTTRADVVDGVAILDNLVLENAPLGEYEIVFVTEPSLEEGSLVFDVIPGPPVRMEVLSQPSEQYVNRVKLPQQPEVALYDVLGNLAAFSDSLVVATVRPTPPVPTNVLLLSEQADEDGVARFDEIEFTGTHGELYVLEFSLSGNPNVTMVESRNITVVPCRELVSDSVSTGPSCICRPGYTLDETGFCLPCPAGTYKEGAGNQECDTCPFNRDTQGLDGRVSKTACICSPGFFAQEEGPDEDCLACPEGGVCPGGTAIEAAPGHYAVESGELPSFIECTRENSCLGGTNSTCADGYQGPLCGVCADGYAGFGQRCVRCPDLHVNRFLLFLAFCFVVVIVGLLVTTAMSKGTACSLTKTFVNFLQQVAFLAFLSVNWPSPVSRMFEAYAVSTLSSRMVPVSCGMELSFYGYFTWYLLLPLLAGAVVFGLCGALYMISQRRPGVTQQQLDQRKFELRNYGYIAMLALLFLTHPTMLFQVLAIHDCVKVGPKSYLAADMSIECGTDEHVFWSTIGGLVLVGYVLLVPAFGAIILFRSRKRLKDRSIALRLRFLTHGFRKRFFYWELVVLARKLLCVFFLAMLRADPFAQAFFLQIILLVSMLTHQHLQPHSKLINSRLEFSGIVITYLMTLAGSMFDSGELESHTRTLWTVVIILGNLLVLCCFLFIIAVGLLTSENLERMGKFFQDLVGRANDTDDDTLMENSDDVVMHSRSRNQRDSQSGMLENSVADSDL